MYNIKIIYVYKILCSQQDMYTITVDFVIVVQKFVCIIFCRVTSQQHGGSGDLRIKFLLLQYCIVIILCTIGVSENKSYNKLQ